MPSPLESVEGVRACPSFSLAGKHLAERPLRLRDAPLGARRRAELHLRKVRDRRSQHNSAGTDGLVQHGQWPERSADLTHRPGLSKVAEWWRADSSCRPGDFGLSPLRLANHCRGPGEILL